MRARIRFIPVKLRHCLRITVSIVARILIEASPESVIRGYGRFPESACEGAIYSIINGHGKGRPDEAGATFQERRALAESF